MTILRLLIFTGMTAAVLAFAAQHFAVGYFLASLLPAAFAAPYVRSLLRSHKIAALCIAIAALIPIYVSSPGPLNALLAWRSFHGYQTPVLDDAMLSFYRPLNLLPSSSQYFAPAFERYLDDWSEIGSSSFRSSKLDPTTGLPVSR